RPRPAPQGGGENLAERAPGLKPARRKIHHLVARGYLHFYLGVGLAERGDYWLQDQWNDRARHREAQQSGGPRSELTRGLAGGDKLLESGLCARAEALAGFG